MGAVSEAAQNVAVDRGRIGRLVGMLGGAGGEKINALAALEKALASAGLSFGWLAEIVERGELPGGDRDKLLRKLAAERLRESLAQAWSMPGGAAQLVRLVLEECEAGSVVVDVGKLTKALAVASDARRHAR